MWKWLRHTLRKPLDDITKNAINWNPQGSGALDDHHILGNSKSQPYYPNRTVKHSANDRAH